MDVFWARYFYFCFVNAELKGISAKGIISDQEYSYCWAGKTVTEIASYKPDMSGIIPKKKFLVNPDYTVIF